MENENLIEKQWYAVTTFTGHEKLAALNIKTRMAFYNKEDLLGEVIVPEETIPSFNKNGKPVMTKNKETGEKVQKTKSINLYPGYVFVQMVMTDETWYIVRNTPEVTGITGSSGGGQKPTPMTEKEIEPILKRMNLIDASMYDNYHIGDIVKIISGTFKDVEGKIIDINKDAGTVKVDIIFFGRHTPADVEFAEIVHSDN